MSQSIQDDEIDLFELFATLWDGKWLIVISTVIFLLGGYAYSQLATKVYQLEARLETPACETSGAEYVGWNCEEAVFFSIQARLLELWGPEFSGPVIDRPNTNQRFSLQTVPPFKLQTSNPLPISVHQETLNQLILEVSRDLLEEADRMQSVLARPNLAEVSQSDVASHVLLKSEIIASLIRETSGSIGSFVILPSSFTVPVSPKTNLILACSLVLGGFVGAAGVLLRKVIRDRALAA